MLKLYVQGECYTAKGESAKRLREILNEKGEDSFTIAQETFYKILPQLINDHKETVQEYVVINGKDVKLREGSPGNWADYPEHLVSDREIAKLGTVILKTGSSLSIELASVSTIDKEIKVYKFSDNELFTNLAQLIHEENIKEIVHTEQSLCKVFDALGIIQYNIQQKTGTVLDLVERHLNINTGLYTIKDAEPSHILRMDEKAAESLLSGDIKIEDEINCCTMQGKRLLRLFIRAPCTDITEIEKRQEIVTELLHSETYTLRSIIKATPDTFSICKTQTFVLSIHTILKVYRFLVCIEKISKEIEHIESLSHEKSIVKSSLEYTHGLIEEISEFIDIPAQEIKETSTEKLKHLGVLREQQKHAIHAEYAQEVNEKKMHKLKPKLEQNALHGYCIRIPRAEENKLTTQIKLGTQKSGALFTTENLKMLNYKLSTIEEQIKVEHGIILKKLTESFGIYKGWILIMNHTVALLDVFSSLAEYAENNSLVRPIFSDGSVYSIRKMYHPLLPTLYRRRIAHNSEIQEPVKNSLEIREKRLCIITGPNMGGKTTFLKAIGLISILAQIGSYVPAEYAQIPIFKQLFIRIGASDNPDKGISTFMAEMIDVSTILNQATEDSLVIIDELGRGTSDEDGYAIAAATAEYIIKLNPITLFATHFHELTKLPNVVNKRVGSYESNGRIVMTYKMEDGSADTSHGINTARRMGFPEEVLIRAQDALKENAPVNCNKSQNETEQIQD